MDKSGFTDDQIVEILCEHDAAVKAADLARKYAIEETILHGTITPL